MSCFEKSEKLADVFEIFPIGYHLNVILILIDMRRAFFLAHLFMSSWANYSSMMHTNSICSFFFLFFFPGFHSLFFPLFFLFFYTFASNILLLCT